MTNVSCKMNLFWERVNRRSVGKWSGKCIQDNPIPFLDDLDAPAKKNVHGRNRMGSYIKYFVGKTKLWNCPILAQFSLMTLVTNFVLKIKNT